MLLLVAVNLGGCVSARYYGQAALGQADIIVRSRSIEGLLRRDDLDAELSTRLQRVSQMREFSEARLLLPVAANYNRYADLRREHVVWNVFAAPADSVEPLTWCYPVVGCVAYRGYFSKRAAERFAETLRKNDYDVFVGGVDAYSTLGWFSDPILNTYIDYPQAELAGLLFHELSHGLLFAKGDTVFNESFATVVEKAGVVLWLQQAGSPAEMEQFNRRRIYRDGLFDLMQEYRRLLGKIYQQSGGRVVSDEGRQDIFDSLYAEYIELNDRFGLDKDSVSIRRSDINNALLASFALYHNLVPAFECLLDGHDGDFRSFYKTADWLAKQPVEQRHAQLRSLLNAEKTCQQLPLDWLQ